MKTVIERMKEMFNGCPLFDGREKGNLNELIGRELTIEDYFKLTGDNGDYHVVTFKEIPDKAYLSCSSLDKLITEFPEECLTVKIKMETPVKTKTNRTYRPIRVIG